MRRVVPVKPWRAAAATAAMVMAALFVNVAPTPPAQAVPGNFQDQVVWSGFVAPTAIAFASNGQVFVAEKSGKVYGFDDLDDATPTLVADLTAQSHNWGDRGLLGLAVDPDFGPARPYLYVQYSYDHVLGTSTQAPRWGTPGEDFDDCPSPPGGEDSGCVISGRLSQLVLTAPTGTLTRERVLVEDWCQQFPSHSIGTVVFGADGYLYAGGGDGASYNSMDYGQYGGTGGVAVNPCGDGVPPGTVPSLATSTGGGLRAQQAGVRGRETVTGDVTLSGTVIRVDPDTGLGVPGNPWYSRPGATPNEKRIIAYGLRNPFRFSTKGGTNEIWLGDVGWGTAEEINFLPDPTTLSEPLNFGWPCFEGSGRQDGYEALDLGICRNLYANGSSALRGPYIEYAHSGSPTTDSCPTGPSSIAGVAYYDRPAAGAGTPYPARYDDSLFFTDYNRKCIWVVLPDANGRPDPTRIEYFHSPAGGVVDLVTGPGGDLFFPNADQGTIHRIRYFPTNVPPVAAVTATPSSGPAPLTSTLSAAASTDAESDELTYEWDLDNDGQFTDATGVSVTRTFPAGTYPVSLRVTDPLGAAAVTTATVYSGSAEPAVTITSPTAGATWRVGQSIPFSGSAVDPLTGDPLPASALRWEVRLLTCDPAGVECVTRRTTSYQGASGTTVTPDWQGEGNTLLQFTLFAQGVGGPEGSSAVRLIPRKVAVSYASEPAGLQVTVGSETLTTPFTRTVIVGSQNSIAATGLQVRDGVPYVFRSWADGPTTANREATTPTGPVTYTARFAPVGGGVPGLVAAYPFDETAGTAVRDLSGNSNTGTATGGTAWAPGRFGGALSFSGTSRVTVPDSASLRLTEQVSMTAWVNPATAKGWSTVAIKQNTGGTDLTYGMYAAEPGRGASGWIGRSSAAAAAALPLNAWTHVAMTYDGRDMRFYRDGTLVATTPRTGAIPAGTGPLAIGSNAVWGEQFSGRLDDLRVYDRALTAAEVALVRDVPLGPVTGDTAAPSVAITAPAAGATVSGTAVSLSATADDDVEVSSVEFRVGTTTVGTDTTAPYSVTWNSTTVPNGDVTVAATARDSAGNQTVATRSVTVANNAPSGPAGLVAAYGFDEATGTAVTDASGLGNDGTARNATRTTTGRFGGALSFNGRSSLVTVPDADSLDATTGVTVMAWVNSTVNNGSRLVVLKENPARAQMAYGLYGAGLFVGPSGRIVSGAAFTSRSAVTTTRLANGRWTHLAMTWDGSTIRLYRNGVQVATRTAGGNMADTTGALRIGGSPIRGEYFAGQIDEVRVYERALSAAEVASVKDVPVG